MSERILYATGSLAPVVFFLSVIVGGANRVGYSHMRDPVSALGMTGAPDGPMVNGAWALVGLLIMVLALAIWRDEKGPGRLSATSLLVAGAASAAIALWFPMDAPGVAMSTAQIGHNILVAVSALAFAAAIVISSLSPAATLSHCIVSYAGLAAMIAGAAGAALSSLYGWPLIGAFERVTQAGYHVWLLATVVRGMLGAWHRR